MKVLDLHCDAGHGFEGWFASEADYESQRDSGRIECPVCGSASLSRRPSAPRLNLSGAREPASARAEVSTPSMPPSTPEQLIAARLAQAVEDVMRRTEDVGERFPEEARRIHYGETAPRGIRGQATPEERAELQDEGIETLSLPMPPSTKRTLQ